jgi:hypothetical protein
MTEILVRYQCDGCSRWTEDPNLFHKVEVRPFNTRGDLPGRTDIYCDRCFLEREVGPQRTGAGFRDYREYT